MTKGPDTHSELSTDMVDVCRHSTVVAKHEPKHSHGSAAFYSHIIRGDVGGSLGEGVSGDT